MDENNCGPVRQRSERTGDDPKGLQRTLLYIEPPVEPVEANVESAGGYKQETGRGIDPEPYGREDGWKDKEFAKTKDLRKTIETTEYSSV